MLQNLLRPAAALASALTLPGVRSNSQSLVKGILKVKPRNVDQSSRSISNVGGQHGQKAQLAEDARDEVVDCLIVEMICLLLD